MKRERKYNLWGWVLFVVCAIFFIASAAINGDVPYIIGSVIFLIASIVFIIPLITGGSREGKD